MPVDAGKTHAVRQYTTLTTINIVLGALGGSDHFGGKVPP